jgi:hypothetical protein
MTCAVIVHENILKSYGNTIETFEANIFSAGTIAKTYLGHL